jgi:hypothetical protein
LRLSFAWRSERLRLTGKTRLAAIRSAAARQPQCRPQPIPLAEERLLPALRRMLHFPAPLLQALRSLRRPKRRPRPNTRW